MTNFEDYVMQMVDALLLTVELQTEYMIRLRKRLGRLEAQLLGDALGGKWREAARAMLEHSGGEMTAEQVRELNEPHKEAILAALARVRGERPTRGGIPYDVIPLIIDAHTTLDDFDEFEAEEAGWPPGLIRRALHEIQRREMEVETAREQFEREIGEAATHCTRCGGRFAAISWASGVLAGLCCACESELAQERAELGYEEEL